MIFKSIKDISVTNIESFGLIEKFLSYVDLSTLPQILPVCIDNNGNSVCIDTTTIPQKEVLYIIGEKEDLPIRVKEETYQLSLREQYEKLVDSKIRSKYTLSQELSILRQQDAKPQQYQEYDNYCEQCKKEARKELNYVE